MNLFISGQKAFGAEVLNTVMAAGFTVAGVSSPAFGTGSYTDGTPRTDRLRAATEAAHVLWIAAEELKADTLPNNTDLIISAHSHAFIGERTRNKARIGAIGYHPSLLPLHRGRDAIKWALKMGDRVTGGSVYWLSNEVDGGDIAAQDWCFVRPGDTAEALWRRELFPMGLRLILQVLRDLQRGLMVRVPQDPALATWEPAMVGQRLYRPELAQIGAPPHGLRVVRGR